MWTCTKDRSPFDRRKGALTQDNGGFVRMFVSFLRPNDLYCLDPVSTSITAKLSYYITLKYWEQDL